ncbi:hypothetical protein EDB19DRAFT_1831197 [Suillus lakei]|nr:hypothetical protein EDB19DRAFT_1831197 [Suillus lakei]
MSCTNAYAVVMFFDPTCRMSWVTDHWDEDQVKSAKEFILKLMHVKRAQRTSNIPAPTQQPSRLQSHTLGSCIYGLHEGDALLVCNDIVQTINQEFGAYSTANISPREQICSPSGRCLRGCSQQFTPLLWTTSQSRHLLFPRCNCISSILMEALQMVKFSLKKERLNFTKGWAALQWAMETAMVSDNSSNKLLGPVSSGPTDDSHAYDTVLKAIAEHKCNDIDDERVPIATISPSLDTLLTFWLVFTEFYPPTMYYTMIPFVSEKPNNRHWDASKLCKLWTKLDSGMMTMEETDQVASNFLDGEIVDLASDWLGNTVIQKLFEKCSSVPWFDENRSDSTQLTSACDKARRQYVYSLEMKMKRQGRISTCSNEASSTPLSPISSPALRPPRLLQCFFSPLFVMIFGFAKPHSLSLLAPPGSCERDPHYSTTRLNQNIDLHQLGDPYGMTIVDIGYMSLDSNSWLEAYETAKMTGLSHILSNLVIAPLSTQAGHKPELQQHY